jgi:hypothetical protein
MTNARLRLAHPLLLESMGNLPVPHATLHAHGPEIVP